QPAPISDSLSAKVYIGGKNISCYGYSDGSIRDTVSGGTPPYTFQWNTGDTTQNLDFDSAGTYVVTITDANACTLTDSITLSQPYLLVSATIDCNYVGSGTSCSSYCDGTITVNVTGGVPPYSYLWNTGDSTQTIDSLCAGFYSVTVTDSNGCVTTASTTLIAP